MWNTARRPRAQSARMTGCTSSSPPPRGPTAFYQEVRAVPTAAARTARATATAVPRNAEDAIRPARADEKYDVSRTGAPRARRRASHGPVAWKYHHGGELPAERRAPAEPRAAVTGARPGLASPAGIRGGRALCTRGDHFPGPTGPENGRAMCKVIGSGWCYRLGSAAPRACQSLGAFLVGVPPPEGLVVWEGTAVARTGGVSGRGR
jgi:hypothetical protein